MLRKIRQNDISRNDTGLVDLVDYSSRNITNDRGHDQRNRVCFYTWTIHGSLGDKTVGCKSDVDFEPLLKFLCHRKSR